MKFKNPVFKKGLNLTIRRGIYKPAKGMTLEIGDMFFIIDGNIEDPAKHEFAGRIGKEKGLVKYVQIMKFDDIARCDLKYHHSIWEADIYEANKLLFEEMDLHYENFNVNEIVTLIFFEVVK